MRISDWSSDVCSSDLRRRRVAQLAHERVDLREAGLGDREMPQLARQSAKGRRVPWSGGAVQVEEAADVDVARLARIEAVEGFDLHSGEEMRHGVAEGDHRARVPREHPGRSQKRPEEATSELQSLMRTAYAVSYLK